MDIEAALLEEHSRRQTDRIAAWVGDEIRQLVDDQLPHASPAFRARARREFPRTR
jgi:hypothetical protein